jgi:hypothetical protein
MSVYATRRHDGEGNPTKEPLADQQRRNAPEDSAVRVQLDALEELRKSEVALECYVRISFGVHTRLANAIRARGWLSESRAQPEKLRSDDYWQRGQDLLDHIEQVADFLEDYELEGDSAFAEGGARFDDARMNAATLIGAVLTGVSQDDPGTTAQNLAPRLRDMQSSANSMFDSCKREVDRITDAMRGRLTEIFSRIESDREVLRMLAQQQQSQQAVSFETPKRPADDESTSERAYTANKPDTDRRQSEVREDQMQSESKQIPYKQTVSGF